MESKIWLNLINILSYRKDLIDTIKPFFENLINNNNKEIYYINEERSISFLQTLSKAKLKLLYSFEIIKEDKYTALIPKKESNTTNTVQSTKNNEEEIKAIIKDDNLEELQRIIRENNINTISSITKSFNEVEPMAIPIIHYCIIEKAIQCFKFLLINGIKDPTETMHEQNPDPEYRWWFSQHRYEWDCIALGIYYGEVEIVKILEEKGIEKGNKPAHIEAAILSYRNSIAKEIIKKMKEIKEEMINENIMIGIIASSKNNNIKGMEMLINNNGGEINFNNENSKTPFLSILRNKTPLHIAAENNSKEIGEILISKGADINAKDIIYQNIG